MIIRSQDKEKIIDTNNIVIDILCLNDLTFKLYEEQNGHLIFAYHSNDIDSDKIHKLGIYSTKEKAIQILDALCLKIEAGIPFFQMPENEEVVK